MPWCPYCGMGFDWPEKPPCGCIERAQAESGRKRKEEDDRIRSIVREEIALHELTKTPTMDVMHKIIRIASCSQCPYFDTEPSRSIGCLRKDAPHDKRREAGRNGGVNGFPEWCPLDGQPDGEVDRGQA